MIVKNDVKLGVIGCGKMASAILGGIFNSNLIPSKNIYVCNRTINKAKNLAEKYSFNFCNDITEVVKCSDVILIATKPFVINEVLDEVKKCYDNQLILSILAGVKIQNFKDNLKNSKIIRIMPNTPALVNCGMSAICPDDFANELDINIAKGIMDCCGKTIITSEDKIDIITALSGSGPAFYYKIINSMAKSAQKLGLSYDEAIALSAQTALGSAKMIFENQFDIKTLINNVTTPGGCTEVGNNVLKNSNLDEILDKTIKDTMQKAIELG